MFQCFGFHESRSYNLSVFLREALIYSCGGVIFFYLFGLYYYPNIFVHSFVHQHSILPAGGQFRLSTWFDVLHHVNRIRRTRVWNAMCFVLFRTSSIYWAITYLTSVQPRVRGRGLLSPIYVSYLPLALCLRQNLRYIGCSRAWADRGIVHRAENDMLSTFPQTLGLFKGEAKHWKSMAR